MVGLRPKTEPNYIFYWDYNQFKARSGWSHTLVVARCSDNIAAAFVAPQCGGRATAPQNCGEVAALHSSLWGAIIIFDSKEFKEKDTLSVVK